MKKCPYCDSQFDDKLNFCMHCGGQLETIVTNTYSHITSDESVFYFDHLENRKKYVTGIILYFVFFYIVSTILSLIIGLIWNLVYKGTQAGTSVEKYMSDVLTWTNFLTYLFALICILIIFKPILVDDKLNFSLNLKYNLKWVGYGILIMFGSIYIAGIIETLLTFNIDTGISENQETINNLMNSSGLNAFLIAIVTIVFAPILEEIIFRKCLFGIFKKNTIVTVILSTIIFASIHVVPASVTIFFECLARENKWINLYLEIIYIFSYLGQGFAISFVYHKTKGNVIPCMLIHAINNLIAFIANYYFFTIM